jgi:hypothetical protein
MPRAKRLSEITRQLYRRLEREQDWKVREIRDRLWDDLIARTFNRGRSVDWTASDQPNRGTTSAVEQSIRNVMGRRRA